jgi:glutamate N-acetyltransferase/amino-acid N-acetyltransferase
VAVNLKPPVNLLPVPGVRLGVAEAAVKKPGRPDVTALLFAPNTQVAAVFTQNAFAAAPVLIARERVAAGSIRALLINSGNANAGTGRAGHEAALQTCQALAEAFDVPAESVLPFSTGVIGQLLPAERICKAIPALPGNLSEAGWLDAARAIMTTDTQPKALSRRVELGDGEPPITITGMTKGAGMIKPNMATMLAFVATDARVSQADLQALLAPAVQRSFNSITVDGDTSTNDACVLAATGQTGPALTPDHPGWPTFANAVETVLRELAQAIVRDGEGATRFIAIKVDSAASVDEARQVAFTVAHSPLVKTACFAGDPNWGRILAAVGRAGLARLDIGRVDIALGSVDIVHQGQPVPGYSEADAAAIMAQAEFDIRIGLGRGDAATTIWTTDLSYEYVRVNAEYRS